MTIPLNELTAERDRRQDQVAELCVKCFGKTTVHERVVRLFEEVVELAQAEKVSPDMLRKIVGHVYARPTDAIEQEVGGIAVTLLAYCAMRKMSADICERNEILRVEHFLEQDPEYFAKRQAAKRAAGVSYEPSRTGTVSRSNAHGT